MENKAFVRGKMNQKPSLFVIEKRELFVLVILFIVITVLAFTFGVRYGKTVGKKEAIKKPATKVNEGC